MGWQTRSNVNYGYPYCTENVRWATAPLLQFYPRYLMCLDGVTNDGYPFQGIERVSIGTEVAVHLYYGAVQPQKLYYGATAVEACYYRGSEVYTG